MIRVARGVEPEALRINRYVHLARARLAVDADAVPSCNEGYAVAREPLYRAQHSKCAYCERLELVASLPVEHFRPKAMAIRGDDSRVPGYWWLAWAWDNLLFSCVTCNGPNRKGNHFALEPGAVPLAPQQPPPGAEVSSLLDPSGEEDPIDHIEFRRLMGHWRPFPRNGSRRGRYTIDKLGLDDPNLLDHYKDHVNGRVQPALDLVREGLRSQRPDEIHRAWRRCLRRLFDPTVPFQGLSHDVLAFDVALATRQRWRLELPRPGRHEAREGSREHAPPNLDKLSPGLATQVSALGKNPGAKRLPVLEAVRAEQPGWTPAELAALFEVTPTTISADLSQLV